MANVLWVGQEDRVGKGLYVVASTICKRLIKMNFFNNMSGYGGCQAFAQIMYRCSANWEDARFNGTRTGY